MLTISKSQAFDKWFDGLKDTKGRFRIQARIDRAELGNFGDCEPVGEGVSEMRIHFGPGYRVYFAQRGLLIVLLLVGGDKSTQAKDIKAAIKLNREIKEPS
jgi:putative addiction module killer protein